MKCRRCGSAMYRHVDPSTGSPKTYCTACSQYSDCAVCSNPSCGTTTCLPCYNGPRSGADPRPLIGGLGSDQHGDDIQ